MKKSFALILKIFSGIILVLLLLLIAIPLLFKDKIRVKVEQVINKSVNATVKFEDYNVGFFRNFPNLSFSFDGLSVVGTDKFENDTLARFKSINLVFNLSSLFKKSGYEVKSIVMDKAVLNLIVRKDGTANWDLMKDTTKTTRAATILSSTSSSTPTSISAPAPNPASTATKAPAPTPASTAPKASVPTPASTATKEPAPTSASTSVSSSSSSGMKLLLKKVTIQNSSISYIDESSSTKVYLGDINSSLKGDMIRSETDMQMTINAVEFTFEMDGMKYLNKAVLDSKIDMSANLNKMKFTFRENYFSINDLKLNFSGTVAMTGNDIETDIKFGTDQTSPEKLLSLIPAVYTKDFKDIKANGEFALSGFAKGVYSLADSTLPDVTLAISVSNGLITYPALAEQIKNINIKSDVFVNGKALDKTVVNVNLFHMEMAGSPLDMTFTLKTPVSDPDFKGSMVGKIDLSALTKVFPMDSISLSGIIDMSVQAAGKMSMIEKAQYEGFTASGTIGTKNLTLGMTGYPDVKISEAGLEFTPAYADIINTNFKVGGESDFTLTGRIENYIPYLFSNKTIKGNLYLRSKFINISEIMSGMASDATAIKSPVSIAAKEVASTAAKESVPIAAKEVASTAAKESVPLVVKEPVSIAAKEPFPIAVKEPVSIIAKDPASFATANTTSLAVIKVPENVDIDIDANIDVFSYDNIRAQKVKGHFIVRNGILSIREAIMNILDGTLLMNADYDTRDFLKPVMKADFEVQNIAVKDAFNMFNMVRKFTPAAKGIDGKINAKMSYNSLLGKDMMPVINSINGEGKIQSDQITLLESAAFDKMKETLKLGDKYTNTFKDVNVSFKITDGRIFVNPFDVKTGNFKMNISGDQGLDQTLNYIVKTEMPRSDLGSSVNSLIDNLSARASAFGIKFKPSDILKVNVKITGTFSKPLVAPLF